MSKIRVYELAKELNVSSKDLITLLMDEFGVEVKNHMSTIEDEEAQLIKELLATKPEYIEGSLEDSKSLVDEYEEILQNELNKAKKKRKKNKREDKDDENEELETEVIEIGETITVKELAEKLNKPSNDVIRTLIFSGVMAAINQEIDFATAEKVCESYGVILEKLEVTEELEAVEAEDDDEENLTKRPPIVTVMGHVDHGKTSLLDAIRKAKVTDTEAGGITQHIGAYTININGEEITFLDTPGHEAFTAMRARGAQVTDVVILVVAADDGIMPQTKEAINHCKAAGVPMVVAINKIDKPGANPDRVKQELTEHGLVVEEWGGDTICEEVSAKSNLNIEKLLEMVLLTAEMLELKANKERKAKGTVIEAKLDKGRGSVATLLVQNGTLHVGDAIIVGSTYGRIRAMFDDTGKKIKSAGPSIPVEVLGLSEVPEAGDRFNQVKDEKTARIMADKRKDKEKSDSLMSGNRVSLEDLYSQIKEGKVKELGIIVKADVQGSVQAINQSLEKLSTDDVKVRVIHSGVGAITETDITLATASNAIVIGFNVRPDNNAVAQADKENVEIKTYRIIYDAIEDVKSAMIGMLEPEYKEVILGSAEVRETYKISNVGTIAGCYVLNGKLQRNAETRVIRDGIVIFESNLSSLKRFKDDVKEVNTGYECGLTVEKFNDVKEGDILECFMMEAIKRKEL
ncbi:MULTISPECIES: translation initiation factor IF-2 [Clostridium]|uniref:Translation initiation factor IF-2 n=1 Tax=Clostridium botulinum (strain Eklund 17B / Type B) TaxID=935198 RepID=IF2_CLOBB|nr:MULTISPECIES: translation initiation factor IF-2 [Clostridium]B2TJ55.1 RecName: Full=Translation initiation factor IF-2 [Clostridium botulinum B str. Eklund 17B (NRP)]MBN1044939.1 translation initiation factor IF-2 [Clostridium botulinum]ACD22023.1 translation initiation factor IF-2 [Clostridium botulinum B str. Eklund 17B (NRP)]MBN1051663.1 translation initiation factor IF-2 [Clostridium botulinum]MBY6974905.1 translation initiation factor IF-2 [Clostridium botulinum]MBY6999885.1 translat